MTPKGRKIRLKRLATTVKPIYTRNIYLKNQTWLCCDIIKDQSHLNPFNIKSKPLSKEN